jgi:hypothetical protein
MALDPTPTRPSNFAAGATGAAGSAERAQFAPPPAPANDGARSMVPQVGPLAATAMVGALWLSATVMNAGWVRIAFAVAIVAALWLLALLVERGVSARVPAAIVASLWLSVVAIALAFNAGDPGVVIGQGKAIEAAIVNKVAPSHAKDDAGPISVASAPIQSTAAADALRGASLAHQGGPCGSVGSAKGRQAVVASGIEPIPVSGSVLDFRGGGGACGPESRIALAGVDVGAVSEGVFVDTRASAVANGDKNPQAAQVGGSLSASHAGSRAAADTIRNGLSQLGAAGGNAGGNSANTPSNSVDSLGNAVDPQGHGQP